MGCDAVVALGAATVSHDTLVGLNSHRPLHECQVLVRTPGRAFALGEVVQTQFLQVPQARQTHTVVGSQPLSSGGYQHGVNQHRVAAACSSWHSNLTNDSAGLLGPELVRLVLERASTARQGFEQLTGLIERHGQGAFPGCPDSLAHDNIFLLADPQEAYVVEAAGSFWACQEIQQTRAVSDVALIRQDWDRLGHNFAERAIAQQWWPEDGSKVDFAGPLSRNPTGERSALRRWGRATYMLEQQNGRIDEGFFRQLLADHYDGTRYEVDPLDATWPVTPMCQHAKGPSLWTAGSLVVSLPRDPERAVVLWCAFGPPCTPALHFPILLDGELPPAHSAGGPLHHPDSTWWRTQQMLTSLGNDPLRWESARAAFAPLGERFEQDVEEFAKDATALRRSDARELARRATLLMKSHSEQFEAAAQQLLAQLTRRGRRAGAGVS